MKKRIFVAAAFTTSWAAHAVPITEADYVIDVEYWGSVTSVTQGAGSVGDPVHGIMRIDTRVAPADFAFFFPDWAGEYNVNTECDRNCLPARTEPSRFVTSPGIADLGGAVYDRVRVIDSALDASGEWDRDEYDLRDWEFSPEGPGYGWSKLTIGVGSPLDFITGDSLVQSFDLRPAESGGAAGGQSETFFGGVASLFEFVIDRVRATPRVCRP